MEEKPHPRPVPEHVLNRQIAILEEILSEIERLVLEEGRPADRILNRFLRIRRELGARDRRFLSQAVFSYFRWRGWTRRRMELPLPAACLIGVALDATHVDPVFRLLEKRCDLPFPAEPLANAPLAEKARILTERFALDVPLSTTDLVPPEFEGLTNPDFLEPCINAFQCRPPTWIRARSNPQSLLEALAERDVEAKVHERLSNALSLSGGLNLNVALADHRAAFVVQDVASQCVALVCSPKPNDEWWDVCAGAGGKSIHLADLMGPAGKVLATDVRIDPLKELKRRARKLGIRTLRSQPHNAVRDEPFRKTFDGVLVDAPCSGWGTWSRNPDARWRTSKREVVQCATRQLRMLENAIWCVKPGGTLVYAVCTLTRPETDEVVANFLDRHPGFALDPFSSPLDATPTDGTLRIRPWQGPGDAMFVARFLRHPD